MKKISKYGEILVIIAGICWGLIGVFTRKISVAGLNSIQVTFLRNFFAALLLFLIVLVKDKNSIRFRPKDIWMFLGTGILSIAFFNVCYFKTIEIASLSVAAVLLYTAPAMVVVMSCLFFREKMTGKKGVALLLAFVGCLFTTGILEDQKGLSAIAILVGLGSGFGYALYSIFGTVATRKYNSFTISLYTFIFAFVALFPISNVKEMTQAITETPSVMWSVICLSAISTIVPFLCYTAGLRHMEAGKASIMAFIEPLVATLCGILIFHEEITLSNMIGIAFIFLSVIILNKKESQTP